jgi:bifunctional DNA-binding transcriptional regulator/antitoxin component of YhaV-PrlF toxin-antitoxin module
MKKQEHHMPKVSIHGNQLTLPEDLREALTTAEDDSLDAEEVVEGILLRRSPSARRKAGLANLREAQSGVRYTGPLPRPSAEEEEQWIADTLYAEKLEERAKRNQQQQ